MLKTKYLKLKKDLSILFIGVLITSPAFAQGLGNVDTLFKNLNTALHTLAAVVIITSIMIVGYKVMFNGESIRDCKNWIIGGALIAGAAEIGGLLFT